MLVQGYVHGVVFCWQCCMLCHIVVQVIVMLVCFCVCCFCLCCCHLLWIWAWLWTLLLLALNNIIVGFACSHCSMFVLMVSIVVFGVVAVFVVVVVSSLSLSIVYAFMFVTGTVVLKQIQVCNVGWDFVRGLRVCNLVVGLVILGFVRFSLEVHAFMALIVLFLLYFCVLSVFFRAPRGW